MTEGRFRIRFDVIGLIGLMVGVVGLYAYYKGRNANLEFVVESATNVVDVNEHVAGLSVVFNGEDLLHRNRALTIYAMTLRNSGNESIRKGDFDESALVGLSLGGATILNAQIDPARTSSENYMRENAHFFLSAPNALSLKPVILDPGDKIGLRVVAIHSSSTRPNLRALGKVVGQKTIPVIFARDDVDNRGVWARAVGGGLGVNLIRLPIYFFAFLLLLIPAIGIPVSIRSWIDKRKRRRIAQAYLEHAQETLYLKWMLDTYVKLGVVPLERLKKLADNPASERTSRLPRGVRIDHSRDVPPSVVIDFDSRYGSDVGIRSGVLSRGDDGSLIVNAAAKRDLDSLIDYLQTKGEFSRDESLADPGE